MLFLSETFRNMPAPESHHHVELGSISSCVARSLTWCRGKASPSSNVRCSWMFPSQEHQLVNRSDDSIFYVAVFKPSLIEQACRSRSMKVSSPNTILAKGVLHTIMPPEAFDLTRRTMDASMIGALDAEI